MAWYQHDDGFMRLRCPSNGCLRNFLYEYQIVSVERRRRLRLPASVQQELILHFVARASALSAAKLCGVSRNTAILYFHKLRELIAERLFAGGGAVLSNGAAAKHRKTSR